MFGTYKCSVHGGEQVLLVLKWEDSDNTWEKRCGRRMVYMSGKNLRLMAMMDSQSTNITVFVGFEAILAIRCMVDSKRTLRTVKGAEGGSISVVLNSWLRLVCPIRKRARTTTWQLHHLQDDGHLSFERFDIRGYEPQESSLSMPASMKVIPDEYLCNSLSQRGFPIVFQVDGILFLLFYWV